MNLSTREKTASTSSLVCLLMGLEGMNITIDLRDETSIKGKVVKVDGFMNIEMEDVLYTAPSGMEAEYESFFCQGKFIRYIHIPKEVNVLDTIKESIEFIGRRGNYRGRRPGGRGYRGGRSRGYRGGRSRGYRGGGRRGHREDSRTGHRHYAIRGYRDSGSRY